MLEGTSDAERKLVAVAIVQERQDDGLGYGSGGDGERLVGVRNCGFGEILSRRQRKVPRVCPLRPLTLNSFNKKHLEGGHLGEDHKFT